MGNKYVPSLRIFGFTEDWKKCSLSEIMEFSNGINAPKESYGIGRKMISVMDILDDSSIIYEEIRNSVQVDENTEDRNKVEYGDLVFVRSSETLNEVGWAKAYIQKEYALFSGFTIRGKSKKDFDAKFIELSLNSANRKQIERKAGGSTRFNASQALLNSVEIIKPPLNEQNAISNLFEDLENVINLKQQELTTLKQTKQGFLQKMFPKEGETVPEVRFTGFSGDWIVKNLGSIMEVKSVKRIHQSDWTEKGIRFLRARDIVAAYKKQPIIDYLYISKDKYNEYSKSSGKVVPGDLLVTGVGSIGVPYLIVNNNPLYFKDGNIIWFKNNQAINGSFLYYSFEHSTIQNYIKGVAGIGTVGTYTIDSGKKTPISIPTKEEQALIGNFFKQLDEAITLQEQELEALKQTKQAFLQKMFV